jgi:two-component system, OmpR family, phosphate regulon sensor histidine kinase PhoR
MRLRWKIALPQILLFLLILAGLLLFLSGFVRGVYLDALQNRLRAECQLLAGDTIPLLQHPGDSSAIQSFLSSRAAALQARLTLIDATGKVLGDTEADPAAMDNHLSRPEIIQAQAQGMGSSTRLSNTTRLETLYTAESVRDGPTELGYFRIAVPLSQIDAVTGRLQAALLVATLLAGGLTLIASLWTAHRVAAPLEDLTNAARQVAEGHLEMSLIPASRDEVGQLTAAFTAMTERLRVQFETLNAERGKLDAVLSQMTDGVMIVDENGAVALLNPSAERLFDFPAAPPAGHSAAEVMRHYRLMELLEECRRQGKILSTTIEIGLQKTYLHAVALPLRDALAGSTLMLFQDLTRLRRLETVRRDFISNLSHDLRTPLASLQALTETLREGALEDTTAARRFLALMQTEVDTLQQMASELLELSQIESGKVPLHSEPMAPSVLLQNASDRMRLLAERNGLTLAVEAGTGLPMVRVDGSRINQVMANLIHNAVKFTPPGGSITLRAEPDEAGVRFAVSDTGAGIPAPDLPRIFERFYKVDPSRSESGTGLGLAIARHLVEAHGGRIWAESALGKGSTFFFTLPSINS